MTNSRSRGVPTANRKPSQPASRRSTHASLPTARPSGSQTSLPLTRALPCTEHDRTFPWAVVETLTGPDECSVVLDGLSPRAFARLTRASVAFGSAVTSRLEFAIKLCLRTGQEQDKLFTLPGDRVIRVLANPVIGPSGKVHAVTVWSGGTSDEPPPPPIAGAIEWINPGLVKACPTAQFLLCEAHAEGPSEHTLPEMLSHFDYWNSRWAFLSLFNVENPTDRWTGTAAKTFIDGAHRQLYLAARASDADSTHTLRAIVCDISAAPAPGVPDPCPSVIRHMPIPPGHAIGLVDLGGGVIHEWMADPASRMAGWLHHNPEIHPSDAPLIDAVRKALLAGTRLTANITGRIRFAPEDEWILLQARWSRVSNGEQPQALIDVIPVPPIPASVVDACPRCQYPVS